MKMKLFKTLAAVMVAFACLIPFGAAFGDAGGFSGSSDYSSSSSSSGSSSYSGGSSYSGSSSYGGSSYSSSSSSDDDAGIETYVIILIIIIIIVIVNSRKGGGNGGGGGGGSRGTAQLQDTFDTSKLRDLASLKEKDPSFDQADVAEDVSNWYVRMQNAWQAGDFSPMQPYFSDALYGQFDRQLKQMKSQGMTNYIENISVLGVNFTGWYEEGGQDFLVALVQTRIIDYTVDSAGNVVSGHKDREKFMTYRYILARTSGVMSGEDKTEQQNCPNCGAPVDLNKSAKCPYCDTVLESNEHSWVISAIQGLKQQTM